MATTTISMFRGDDKTIRPTVKDTTGALVDLTGARIIFTVSTNPSSVVKDSDVGSTEVEIIDQVSNTGEFEIKLVPDDTAGTTPKEIGNYQFDIEMQLGGKTSTLVKGFLKLEAGVTV